MNSLYFSLINYEYIYIYIYIYIYKSQSNLPNRLQLYKPSFLICYNSICKVDICYNTHRYFLFADVTFFENSFMFPITHPPRSDVISVPLLYPALNTSPVPLATPPRPLQVYTRCPCTDTGPLTDSSPMAPSSMTLVFPSPADLPIAIQKGYRSSYNPHSIYNFVTYHRLSSPYFAFVSTLSFVYVPQTMLEALSHPDWK